MVFLEKNSQKSIHEVLNNFIGLNNSNLKNYVKFGFQENVL